jgi:AraC-like DNA-binding protein
MHNLAAPRDDRFPDVLATHRTRMGGRDMQVSVCDTHLPAQSLAVRVPHPTYCGVIAGRTAIRPEGADGPVDVVPGESVVVPAGRRLHVDFPDAQEEAPTTCITLVIEPKKAQQMVDRLGKTSPRSSASGERARRSRCVHISNTPAIERVLQTLLALFSENHPDRDALIDLSASELVVRMLRTEARLLLTGQSDPAASAHGMAAAMRHIHDHLDRHLSVEELADVACMSRSTFHRKFRDEFGSTPHRYVHQLRMGRARSLLHDEDRTVTDVSLALGFRSVSHFITRFKQSVGVTPKTYQDRLMAQE